MIEHYYQNNKGTLYCSNCLDIMGDIFDGSVNLTITSPPYGKLRDYKGYIFDFENIAKELFRITKIGGVVVWIVGDVVIKGFEENISFKQALYFKEIGFGLYDTMIYQKNGLSNPGKNRYHQCFEYMFILSKNCPKTVNLISDKKNLCFGDFCSPTERLKDGLLKQKKGVFIKQYGIRSNIWKYETGNFHSAKDKIAYKHPAIFPEALAQDHIISWSNEEDIILDPMCGSGTTLKMAERLNRKWIGIEISEEYCEIAKKRIELEAKRPKISKLKKEIVKLKSFGLKK